MEKLSIQEFQNLKDRVEEIYQEIVPYLTEDLDVTADLTEAELTKLEERFEEYQKEIDRIEATLGERDLSEIPFEAWDGFRWLTQQMHLEGTGANIDLSKIEIIEFYSPVRLKGCNVRNFDFSKGSFDEESFDDAFMEVHSEHFTGKHILDPEAKKRFYARRSTLMDIIQYQLDIDLSSINSADRKIVAKLGIEQAKKIDLGLLEALSYDLTTWIQEGTLGSVEETYGANGSEKDINELILARIRYDIEQGDNLYRYDSYMQIPYLKQHLPEYIIDFGIKPRTREQIYGLDIDYTPEEARREQLLSNYKSRYLKLSDVLQNYDMFRGKKYVQSLYENVRGNQQFTEEQIDDFYSGYGDIVPVVIQLGASIESVLDWYVDVKPEERDDVIKLSLKNFVNTARRDNLRGLSVRDAYIISKYVPDLKEISLPNDAFLKELLITHKPEELEASSDVRLLDLETSNLEEIRAIGERFGSYEFANKNIKPLIYRYGMPDVIKLDEETDGMLQALLTAYGDNVREMLANSYNSRYSVEENAEYKDSEAAFANIIRDLDKRKNFVYGNFRGGFAERYPELYLPQDAPSDLANKYYTRQLDIKDLKEHPEWQQYFLTTSLSAGVNRHQNYITKSDESWEFVNTFEYLENNYSREDILKFAMEFSVFFDNKSISLSSINLREKMDWEQVREQFYHGFNEMTRNFTPYSDSLPQDYKDKYPDMFFSDNIPADIREKIYNGKIEIEDIRKVPGLYEELQKKDSYAMMKRIFSNNSNLATIQRIVGQEGFLKLASKYGYYMENANFPIYSKSTTFEEVELELQKCIAEKIVDGRLFYGPDAPDFFKEARPDLFLDENAPELLKLSFYSRYTSEHPDYLNYSANNYRLMFENIAENPEWVEFLRGKALNLVAYTKHRRMYEKFDFDTVVKFIQTDAETLSVIAEANSIDTFAEFYYEKSEYFAWKEMKDIEGIPQEVSAPAVLGFEPKTPEQIEAKKMFDKKLEKFKLEILRSPGVFLDYPQDKLSEFNFGEFRDLKSMSGFRNSSDYRRGMEENIIAHMYAFLGYSETKKMLQLPNLSTEDIERLYDEQNSSFEAVYEKRFKIKGNVKVLNSFFEKFEPTLPGGKSRFEVYKALNQKLEEGYEGDLYTLLAECFSKAGVRFDEAKLKLCTENTENVHTAEKMSFVKDEMMAKINQYIQENPADKKILFDNLFSGMKECLAKNRVLDKAYIEEYLKTEFSRVKEDGTSFYSLHVTEHIPELLRIVDDFNNTPEISKLVNAGTVELLKDEKQKIGNNWIRKARTISDNLTLGELEVLEERLYGETGHTIDYTKHVELRNNTEQGRKEAFELLKKDSNPMLLTYAKAEKMFNSFTGPYSPAFAEYFVKHKEEFMSDPKYYTILKKMNDNFDEIMAKPHNRNRAAAGKFTVAELERVVNDIRYENVQEGEYELEYAARLGGLNPQYFPIAQSLFAQMKERSHQTIPQMDITRGRFRGRILRIDDPLHLMVGDITDCCQAIGTHAGEGSMVHSATEKNGSVFIVEEYDEHGNYVNTVAQSWTWRNGDRICFDNVEIPDSLEEEFVQNGTHNEIFEVYREAARLILENDKKAMQSLIDSGKITKAQYDILIAKDVTMGTGCDDLLKHLTGDVKRNLKTAKIVSPLEANKGYNAVQKNKTPWIDSKGTQYIVATMDSIERKGLDTQGKASLEEIPLQYTRTREMISRKGMGIHRDILKSMRDMKVRENDMESFVASKEIEEVDEVLDYERGILSKDDVYLNMSTNEDWYILSTKSTDTIKILDTSLTTGRFGTEAQKPYDTELAKLEYAQAMQRLILEASDTNKKFEYTVMDDEKSDIFKQLAMEKIISIGEDGSVSLLDREALAKKIESDRDKIEKGTFERNIVDVSKPDQVEDEKDVYDIDDSEER